MSAKTSRRGLVVAWWPATETKTFVEAVGGVWPEDASPAFAVDVDGESEVYLGGPVLPADDFLGRSVEIDEDVEVRLAPDGEWFGVWRVR